MQAIRALAEEIGPRLACSREEARAAEWCAAKLSEAGYEASIEPFPSRPHYQSWYALYLGLAALGAAVMVPFPPVALILGVAAAVLYARDAEGRPLIRPSSGESRNVVARPPGSVRPVAVVMAHLDSARSSISFHPKLVSGLRSSIVALHLVLAAVPVLAGALWIFEVENDKPALLWLPAGLLCAYLLFAISLQVHAVTKMPVVAGANDNASGVEILMRLAAERPPGTWFVVTGSEEAGMIGAQAFISAHATDIGDARFLNIDNVGAGKVIAASDEGILRPHAADPELLDAALAAGAEERAYVSLPTDATVLLARRYRAVSLLALNEAGVLPNWHWPSDVAGNIDRDTLDSATHIARSVLSSILERAGR